MHIEDSVAIRSHNVSIRKHILGNGPCCYLAILNQSKRISKVKGTEYWQLPSICSSANHLVKDLEEPWSISHRLVFISEVFVLEIIPALKEYFH